MATTTFDCPSLASIKTQDVEQQQPPEWVNTAIQQGIEWKELTESRLEQLKRDLEVASHKLAVFFRSINNDNVNSSRHNESAPSLLPLGSDHSQPDTRDVQKFLSNFFLTLSTAILLFTQFTLQYRLGGNNDSFLLDYSLSMCILVIFLGSCLRFRSEQTRVRLSLLIPEALMFAAMLLAFNQLLTLANLVLLVGSMYLNAPAALAEAYLVVVTKQHLAKRTTTRGHLRTV